MPCGYRKCPARRSSASCPFSWTAWIISEDCRVLFQAAALQGLKISKQRCVFSFGFEKSQHYTSFIRFFFKTFQEGRNFGTQLCLADFAKNFLLEIVSHGCRHMYQRKKPKCCHVPNDPHLLKWCRGMETQTNCQSKESSCSRKEQEPELMQVL